MIARRSLLTFASTFLAGCATRVWDESRSTPNLEVQNLGLNPRNGGLSVTALSLRAGDIVLSSANGINSVGVC